jgi:hypothetical protein
MTLIGSPLLFICSAACSKSIRDRTGRRWGAPSCFVCIGSLTVTPHISNPYDYVNYMFKRP